MMMKKMLMSCGSRKKGFKGALSGGEVSPVYSATVDLSSLNIQGGDLIVAFLSVYDLGDGAHADIDGFTEHVNEYVYDPDSYRYGRMRIISKIADGTEDTLTIETSYIVLTERLSWTFLVFPGVDQSSIFANSFGSTYGRNPTPPYITTVEQNSIVLFAGTAASSKSGASVFTYSGEYDELFIYDNTEYLDHGIGILLVDTPQTVSFGAFETENSCGFRGFCSHFGASLVIEYP